MPEHVDGYEGEVGEEMVTVRVVEISEKKIQVPANIPLEYRQQQARKKAGLVKRTELATRYIDHNEPVKVIVEKV